MIQIKNLYKHFGAKRVLEDINVHFVAGSVNGLLGPNGCGKTTLVKSILGLVYPEKGQISYQDKNIISQYQYRKEFGYMPQAPAFPENLTVTEILFMIESLHQKEAPLKNELIKLFDLDAFLDKPFGTLSGGTKQKVSAVVCFMFEPKVLILDEPTVGLDPISSQKLKLLIKRSLEQGQTVILVSHIIREMEQLVTHITYMLEGKVRYQGTVDEVKTKWNSSELEVAILNMMENT